MKKYKVILHPDAEFDINSSFKWGCLNWGRPNAIAWVRKLRHTLRERLTTAPLACPVAPESEELNVSVGHLIVGRYRILFVVEKKTVTVIHVRGSYAGRMD